MFLPAGTSPDIVTRLNSVLNAALANPKVVERMAQLSIQSRANTPEDFAHFVGSEIAKWGKIIRDADIKVE